MKPFVKTLVLLGVLTALRLLVSGMFGPGDAEALYWNYGQHLQFAYLDHPPLIGLCLAAVDALFGTSPMSIRLVPILCFVVTVVFTYMLAASMWKDERAGWIAALLACASPASLIGGMAAAPDSVLSMFWMMALYTVWKSISEERPGFFLPAAAGLCIGLAFLSKHTGACLAAGVLLTALMHGSYKKPGFWTGLVTAAAVVSPVVLWNLEHDWIQLRHRLIWSQSGAGFSLRNLGALAGGQVLYTGPVLILFLWALARLWKRRREKGPALVVYVSGMTLVCTYLLCLWSPVAEPHWPFAGYLALAAGVPGVIDTDLRTPRRIFKAAIVWSSGMYILAHVFVLTPLLPRFVPRDAYEPRYDISNELYGWGSVASKVRAIAVPGEKITSSHYTMCSQLAFHLGRDDDPAVVCASDQTDDFDLWKMVPGARDRLLFVADNRFSDLPQSLSSGICSQVSTLEVRRGGRWVRRFRFIRCEPALNGE